MIIELVGVAGGLCFLFGFYRIAVGKWTGKSLWYELDNLLGAILMSVYAYNKKAYINILLNLVWGFVAFWGVTAYAQRKKKKIRKLFDRMVAKR